MTGEPTALDVVSAAVTKKMTANGYTFRDAAAAVDVPENTVIRLTERSPRVTWGQLVKLAAWADLEIRAVPREVD